MNFNRIGWGLAIGLIMFAVFYVVLSPTKKVAAFNCELSAVYEGWYPRCAYELGWVEWND